MSKKNIKKKKKKEESKKSIDKNHKKSRVGALSFSVVLFSLGVFFLISKYFETEKGVFGYLLEITSLYTFGNVGFIVIPFLLVFCGVVIFFSKRTLLFNCIYFFISLACVFEVLSLVVFDTYFPNLKNYGYIGQTLNYFSLTFFGKIGSVFGLSLIFLILTSINLGISLATLLKPLSIVLFPFKLIKLFFYKLSQAFYLEYKKISNRPNFFKWLVHRLFFTKQSLKKHTRSKKKNNFDQKTKELIHRTLDNQTPVVQLEQSEDAFEFNTNELIIDDTNSIEALPVNAADSNDLEMQLLDASAESDLNSEPNIYTKVPDDEQELNTITIDNSFEVSGNQEESSKNVDNRAEISDVTEVSFNDDLEDIDESYMFPSIELLEKGTKPKYSMKALTKMRVEKASLLEETLASFNVKAKVVNITPGPSITRYELQPGDGVKISKITALSKDISLKLAAPDIRIEAPIPGKALVGIEVPNEDVQMITLRSILEESSFSNSPEKLIAGLGKTITGDSIVMDLAKMPHVLIAGATGSGKSVCINTIILSILMRAKPSEVKFLMIDPKKVELSLYEGIPHLVAPVVTDPNKAAATLKRWALVEMENRYEIFSKVGVKDIKGFNAYVEQQNAQENTSEESTSEDSMPPLQKIPYIVVIIDELADLMMVASQDVEQTICRLAQMARATGIHLVIATQRPSVNVVTGLIKANVPSRVSFYLQSQIDSRTILDMAGAEKLLGKGDMLYSPVGAFNPVRAQGVFVGESEVKGVVTWLKGQGKPDYLKEIIEVEPLAQESSKQDSSNSKDELYEDAKQLIINTKYASTSYLQRKLRIGYNRAARIMDELEENGVISEYVGEKKSRQVN